MGRLIPVLVAGAALTVLLISATNLVLLLAACASVYLALHHSTGAARRVLALCMFMALPIFLLNVLLVSEGETALFIGAADLPLGDHILVFTLRITLESMAFSTAMVLQLTNVVGLFYLISQDLTPEEIFGSAPSKVTMLVATSARFIPVIEDDARKSAEAQAARGLYSGESTASRLKGARYVLFPLLARSVARASDISEAYATKGLLEGGIRPSRPPAKPTGLSLAALALSVTFAILGLGAAAIYPKVGPSILIPTAGGTVLFFGGLGLSLAALLGGKLR